MVTGNYQGHGQIAPSSHDDTLHHLRDTRGRRREIDKDASDVQARVHTARHLVEHVKEISAKRNTALKIL